MRGENGKYYTDINIRYLHMCSYIRFYKILPGRNSSKEASKQDQSNSLEILIDPGNMQDLKILPLNIPLIFPRLDSLRYLIYTACVLLTPEYSVA